MNWVTTTTLIVGSAGVLLAGRAAKKLTRAYTQQEVRSTFVRKTDRAVPGLRMQRIYSLIAADVRNNVEGAGARVKRAASEILGGIALVVVAVILRSIGS